MDSLLDFLYTLIMTPISYLWQENQRVYWLFLVVFIVMALGVFYYRDYANQETGQDSGFNLSHFFKAFAQYVFPKAIYSHPSFWADLQFFALNSILTKLLWAPFTAGAGVAITLSLTQLLSSMPLKGCLDFYPAETSPFWGSVLLTLVSLLCMDFGLFVAHYLQHRIPLLWEFHKVHHSAEVLNPLTVYRMHPVDDIFAYALTGLTIAAGQAILQHLHPQAFSEFTLFGVNLGLGLFFLLGYSFRHSHIWIDYGPFWSQYLMSPAQHQIHHSMAPQHIDKNMGFTFSFWDQWFGTLYIPKEKESLTLGIDGTEEKGFHSLAALYLKPVANVLNQLSQGRNWPAFTVFVVSFFLLHHLNQPSFQLTPFVDSQTNSHLHQDSQQAHYPFPPGELSGTKQSLVDASNQASSHMPLPSLWLEELTWQEVKNAIQKGYTAAIIPTGGVEQNGPHLVLGKHNRVIHYTSEKIAETLHHTLIAPIITYVPEGNAEEKTGHMSFSGTMTVSDETFEALLESAAKSLKAHGFKRIYLIGDSGWNQAPQERVAQKLNALWAKDGVRVIHVGHYYDKNHQVDWLKQLGKTEVDIGSHAGIRDTSELMFTDPSGIRSQKIEHYGPQDYAQLGSNGDAASASPQLGQALLDLKIKAAVQEIQNTQKSTP
jgi:creatinine amidohydrolase/Fe(II)-dependent formamide hydrolase-like protein/sterol desaturase/sphingolipid hydroxylase (fatty acid hydroxylase superfamily)